LSVRLSVRRLHYYFPWGWPIALVYGPTDCLWSKDPEPSKEIFSDWPWTR
jgi:hypothetical protein